MHENVPAHWTRRSLAGGERLGRWPNAVVRIRRNGQTIFDANGYPEGNLFNEALQNPGILKRLSVPMRVNSGPGGSPAFFAYELITAIRGGAVLTIRDSNTATA